MSTKPAAAYHDHRKRMLCAAAALCLALVLRDKAIVARFIWQGIDIGDSHSTT